MVVMSARVRGLAPLFVTFFTFNPVDLAAQTADAQSTICGMQVPAPAALPPAGSPPVIYAIVPCFEP